MTAPHASIALAAVLLLAVLLALCALIWLLWDIRGKLEQALYDYKLTMLSHVQSVTLHRTPDHDRRLILMEENIRRLEDTQGKLI